MRRCTLVQGYRCPRGVLVSRDTFAREAERVLVVPLRDFLLAY